MVDFDYNQPYEICLEVVRVFFLVIPLVFVSIPIAVIGRAFFRRNSLLEFLFQVLCIVPLVVLSYTIFVDYVFYFVTPFLLATFLITTPLFLRKWDTNGTFELLQIYMNDRPKSITFIRSAINMITSFAILACDFKIFPSDFHKSTFYGVGLMDTGIGLFVFSMGIVSKPVKTKKAWQNTIFQVVLLLSLGVGRTVLIRFANYHQNEREYGRDLNGFFTLGLTRLFGGMCTSICSTRRSVLLSGVIIAVIHEVVLQSGMAEYCLDEEVSRSSFLEANREGLMSISGFVSIHLISVYMGSIMWKSEYFTIKLFKFVFLKLLGIASATWILTFVCIYTIEISRRIANFGYISWIVSLASTTLIISSMVFDVLLKVMSKRGNYLPVIFDIVNYNGLIYFVLSNLLTGFVNAFLSPWRRSPAETIYILIVYMAIPCIFNRILYVKRFRIR